MQNPRGPLRHELVSWEEVDKLVDVLVPQIEAVKGFDTILLITRGGIIPGGLLAEALDINYVLTAAVRFPDPILMQVTEQFDPKLALPSFLQFPEAKLIEDRQILIVDDVWGSGRTSTTVKGRCEAARAKAYTCVFHFNPYRSLMNNAAPDFYAATTDAHIIYPWEVDRDIDGLLVGMTEI